MINPNIKNIKSIYIVYFYIITIYLELPKESGYKHLLPKNREREANELKKLNQKQQSRLNKVKPSVNCWNHSEDTIVKINRFRNLQRKEENDRIIKENEIIKKCRKKVKDSDELHLKYKSDHLLKKLEEQNQLKEKNKERVFNYLFIYYKIEKRINIQ